MNLSTSFIKHIEIDRNTEMQIIVILSSTFLA